MKLKKELPRTGDINKCCGRETVVGRIRVDVRMMTDPPKTSDRWFYIFHWQCMVREDHSGEYCQTSDEAKITHANVFEDNADNEELGHENQQRN